MLSIPAQNLIHQPNPIAACRGFRLFAQSGITPDFPPLRVMNYAFGLILSGTATERIGLQAYAVKPYSVVFTYPGQIISYAETSADLSFLYFVLDDEFIVHSPVNRNWLDHFGFFRAEGTPVFNLPVPTGQRIHQLLDAIKAEYEAAHADYELLIPLYVYELFIQINRVYAPDSATDKKRLSRGQVISRTFKELVNQHFRQQKRVQQYADLLAVTPRHLNELIKTQTGQSPSYWILAMEILEAKYQLKYTTRTIAEVADDIGYPDAAYFSKVFRKVTGLSPLQYRLR